MTPPLDAGPGMCTAAALPRTRSRAKLPLALLACLAVAACAGADGSRPRLSADAPAGGFTGAYAGASGGLAGLGAKGTPF